jgi:two-component system cell cycle response regulator DivK
MNAIQQLKFRGDTMVRIVVIEDNPVNMKLVTYILKTAGMEVLQAVDAESGLELIRAEKPALVLMDVQLPGMDGICATRLLKSDPELAHIKVVALTANAMKGDSEILYAAGCEGYLTKPFHHQQLMEVVYNLLNIKQ